MKYDGANDKNNFTELPYEGCGEQRMLKRTHSLTWVKEKGLLADALGIDPHDPDLIAIEELVEAGKHMTPKLSMLNLFRQVGEMELTDAMWANFLYTFGFWQGQQ